MASLADRPEIVGFFSYSREDDEDSKGGLSALRDRIQRELRGQLGRKQHEFRLWQDKEAIAAGKLWESEIKAAIAQSLFIIPIITPTTTRSPFCQFEFQAFLDREHALGRNDLIFPLLYIRVPELEAGASRPLSPVLAMLAARQYVDWRRFRHQDVYSAQVSDAVERLCDTIVHALTREDAPETERASDRQLEEHPKAPPLESREEPILPPVLEARPQPEQTRPARDTRPVLAAVDTVPAQALGRAQDDKPLGPPPRPEKDRRLQTWLREKDWLLVWFGTIAFFVMCLLIYVRRG